MDQKNPNQKKLIYNFKLPVSENVPKEELNKELNKFLAKLEQKYSRRRTKKSLLKIPLISSYEIFKYLGEYLYFQGPALSKLSHAFYDHLLKIKRDIDKKSDSYDEEVDVILQIGGTGSGKSESMRKLSEILEVPYVHATAEQFTASGYVGRDVEELLVEAVKQAREMGDEKLAEYAIVHIDEIDKIINEGSTTGRDVGGESVQEALLKLFDKGEVTVSLDSRKTEQVKVRTKNIFFVLSGAFDGDGKTDSLETIIKKRLRIKEKTMGFSGNVDHTDLTIKERKKILYQTTGEDLTKYRGKGMIRQLVSRISSIIVYTPYSADELSIIFSGPKNSFMDQSKWAFERWGIKINYTPEAIKLIGKEAEKMKTGARGLKSIISRFRDRYGFILSNIGAEEFTVTEDVIRDPEGKLPEIVEDVLRTQFSGDGKKIEGISYIIQTGEIFQKFSEEIVRTNTAAYHAFVSKLRQQSKDKIHAYKVGEIKENPVQETEVVDRKFFEKLMMFY